MLFSLQKLFKISIFWVEVSQSLNVSFVCHFLSPQGSNYVTVTLEQRYSIHTWMLRHLYLRGSILIITYWASPLDYASHKDIAWVTRTSYAYSIHLVPYSPRDRDIQSWLSCTQAFRVTRCSYFGQLSSNPDHHSSPWAPHESGAARTRAGSRRVGSGSACGVIIIKIVIFDNIRPATITCFTPRTLLLIKPPF